MQFVESEKIRENADGLSFEETPVARNVSIPLQSQKGKSLYEQLQEADGFKNQAPKGPFFTLCLLNLFRR